MSGGNPAVEFLRSLEAPSLAEIAMRLFPDNVYQRVLFYCYVLTVQNCEKPEINPRSYVPNLIGAPGFGKSGLVYQMGQIMTQWLTESLGQPTKFNVITRTLAGANAFEDIIGITNVDKETNRTRIAPPESFPVFGDGSLGLIFIDD